MSTSDVVLDADPKVHAQLLELRDGWRLCGCRVHRRPAGDIGAPATARCGRCVDGGGERLDDALLVQLDRERPARQHRVARRERVDSEYHFFCRTVHLPHIRPRCGNGIESASESEVGHSVKTFCFSVARRRRGPRPSTRAGSAPLCAATRARAPAPSGCSLAWRWSSPSASSWRSLPAGASGEVLGVGPCAECKGA